MRHRTLVFWSRCFAPLLGLALALLCLWSLTRLAVSAQSGQPLADLQVEKSSEGGVFPVDGPLVFAVNVRNAGAGVAQDVRLRDILPAGTAYLTDTSGAAISVEHGELVWELDAVGPGASRRFYLLLSHLAASGTTLHNQMFISGLNEGDTSNNTSSADVLIHEGQPDLWVSARCTPLDPAPGETFVFGIEYGNSSSIGTGTATLTLTLPASTTLVSWASESVYGFWSQVRLDANRLVLAVPAVPGNWGDTLQVRLRLHPNAPVGAELRGAADLVVGGDLNVEDKHAEGLARVARPRADGAVRLEFAAGQWVPGGYVEYDAWYGNQGNTMLHMALTDTLPAGTRFQSFRLRLPGDAYQDLVPVRQDDSAAAWDIPGLEPGVWQYGRLRLSILPATAPGSVLENCLEGSISAQDIRPFNDQACVTAVVHSPGPNLYTHGSSTWDSAARPAYEIGFANVGSLLLDGASFTVTYPASTTWTGILYSWGAEVQITHTAQQRRLVASVLGIPAGASGGFGFPLQLDPALIGQRGMAFTCALEASAPGDVYPGDNRLELAAYSGPDVYVRQWLSGGALDLGELVTLTCEFGNSNRWWGTQAGIHITSTLAPGLEFVNAWNPNDWTTEWQPDRSANGDLVWSWGAAEPESRWAFRMAARVSGSLPCGAPLIHTLRAYSDHPGDAEFFLDNNVSALRVRQPGNACRLFLPVVKSQR